MQLRTGAQADAVEDGEADGDTDPLLHADDDDGEERHRRQCEFEAVEAGNGHQVLDTEQPQSDEDQDGGQRRQGHIPEHVRKGDEDDDHRCRPKGTRLGAAPGIDDGTGVRRAGVDREGAHQAGHDAARADTEEVASHVNLVAIPLGEGPRRGCGLGHDDERHHGGQGRQAHERRP